MDSKAWLSFRSRSNDTTSESMRTNGKDGRIGLMKSSRQNWRRKTSSRSCYYQPGGGLTRCQSLKVEDGGKGHTSEWGVGSVNVAQLRIRVLKVASVRNQQLSTWSKSSDFCYRIEKFIIRQPPIGEKDDYDSEISWISDGLPSSSRRRRRGGGRWENRNSESFLWNFLVI